MTMVWLRERKKEENYRICRLLFAVGPSVSVSRPPLRHLQWYEPISSSNNNSIGRNTLPRRKGKSSSRSCQWWSGGAPKVRSSVPLSSSGGAENSLRLLARVPSTKWKNKPSCFDDWCSCCCCKAPAVPSSHSFTYLFYYDFDSISFFEIVSTTFSSSSASSFNLLSLDFLFYLFLFIFGSFHRHRRCSLLVNCLMMMPSSFFSHLRPPSLCLNHHISSSLDVVCVCFYSRPLLINQPLACGRSFVCCRLGGLLCSALPRCLVYISA